MNLLIWLMVHGAWLKAPGSCLKAKKIGARSRGLTQCQFFLCLEPSALKHEQWALSNEPWTNDNRSINDYSICIRRHPRIPIPTPAPDPPMWGHRKIQDLGPWGSGGPCLLKCEKNVARKSLCFILDQSLFNFTLQRFAKSSFARFSDQVKMSPSPRNHYAWVWLYKFTLADSRNTPNHSKTFIWGNLKWLEIGHSNNWKRACHDILKGGLLILENLEYGIDISHKT